MERTTAEVEKLIDEIEKFRMKGASKFPGMSYEDGIAYALEWILEDGPDPMEE